MNYTTSKSHIIILYNVVVCTDLSDIEAHIQVRVNRMIASGSLESVMVSMLAPEWQEVWI